MVEKTDVTFRPVQSLKSAGAGHYEINCLCGSTNHQTFDAHEGLIESLPVHCDNCGRVLAEEG